MSASQHARRERQELAELMLATGPDAPTLCEGWTTRDLAAHLVVREARPDAALGHRRCRRCPAGPSASSGRRPSAQSYPELVRKVRTGPPTLSVFSIPGADGLANLIEYVVHHEDVLRAQPDWEPRALPPTWPTSSGAGCGRCAGSCTCGCRSASPSCAPTGPGAASSPARASRW